MAELKTKIQASDMVYRDGSSSEGATHNVSYIPHLVIVDGEGKSLQAYDSSALGSLHENETLCTTIHDKAASFKE